MSLVAVLRAIDPSKRKCERGRTGATAQKCGCNTSLTLRSSGRPTSGFACCWPPLNSNVRLFELLSMQPSFIESHSCAEVGPGCPSSRAADRAVVAKELSHRSVRAVRPLAAGAPAGVLWQPRGSAEVQAVQRHTKAQQSA